MVFKPFTTLARQSISKHLVNGYTQSLVAASQSSYASSTLPIRIGQSNAPVKIQNAFGGAHSGRAAPGKDGSATDAVNAFHAVQNQTDDKDDKKYLFSRKILWSKAQHQQQQKQLLGNPPEPIAEPLPSRSRSTSFTSVIEEVDAVEEIAVLKDAVVIAEEAVAEEAIVDVVEESLKVEVEQSNVAEPAAFLSEEALLPEPSEATKAFNSQLQSLHDHRRWEEVTVLFRHMVEQGLKPSTTTYNLLLDSIVSLRPQYVAQVIDVYSAMLREKLIPTTTTYSILINFLAQRALRSHHITTTAQRDAARSGILLDSKKKNLKAVEEEGALNYALGLFYDSTEVRTERAFPMSIYRVLIEACSTHGLTEDMLNVSTHLESHGLSATPEVIRSMIRGFGEKGDVRAVVETYNGWQDSDIAKDSSLMNERYQIYTELIAALMASGDIPGALTFLEKVVDISQEHARLEWLKQAVVEGFVSNGDILSAEKWMQQLDIKWTSNEWLALLSTRLADQGEFNFALQIYNTINPNSMEFESQRIRELFAECQMSCLEHCAKTGQVEKARELWADLWKSERSAGPNISTALVYTRMLFENGCVNEALVVLNQFSRYFLEQPTSSPDTNPEHILNIDARRLILLEGFENTILYLSSKGLLTPSIGLDVAGFSFRRCSTLRAEASRRVLDLFDKTRLWGLTSAQLSLTLQLQYLIISGEGFLPIDSQRFETMFNIALEAGFPVSGPEGEILGQGAALLAQVNPNLSVRWDQYARQQAGETLPDDPYWNKIDIKTSNAIDATLTRSKYNKIADLRRMYRNTRRSGKSLRLTTLAEIITAASRGGVQHSDFIDEIVRNARIDLPWMPQYTISRSGWSDLLNAMTAAQLVLGNRDKAAEYHDEMLKMGESPTANTYGLYIVYLKGVQQTYDEASEAVAIFERALAEGVVPTPFLYNAVIGKLAKARRVDDCLFYFALMRTAGIKPTSVTYGTMINALTRVGDESFAEELFKEMELMSNYKPRPAPYNSMIQFFITTKRDRSKVLSYYNRMLSLSIAPTSHTYKLMIEAYATLDQPDMAAAEAVLDTIRASGLPVESSHHAALIHAKGCVLHDVSAAIKHFEDIIATGLRPDSTLYQALLECLVANHRVAETPYWVQDMVKKNIMMTPYIANTLIHGWTLEKNIDKAREVYEALGNANGQVRREPSTYEAMTRAYLAVEDREGAKKVADEMVGRRYPSAVVARVLDLVRMSEPASTAITASA
ncbi:hypothetical protein BDD12DRAFT_127203 [Trichophaea hybrida]|nr:hypothetical protein BDD12DRAFT_127203 [Trichophaea hybrida]